MNMHSETNGIVLDARHIKKFYYKNEAQTLPDGSRRYKTTIRSVDDVSLALLPGEVLGVLGETGCGKSTLGRVLTGLEPPTGGDVLLGGESIRAIQKRSRKELCRKAQMIFQNPFDVFDARFSIERVLTGTLALHNIGSGKQDRTRLAMEALESAGLNPAAEFMKRYPCELSGGQLQRISIIRSMLLNPLFLVADEPISMLDVSVRADIINTLRRVTSAQKTAVVFISHDIATTKYIANRLAIMYLGQIVEMGPTEEVMRAPQHPYTKALISNCPSINPRAAFNPTALPGDPPSPAFLPKGCYFAPRCAYAKPECEAHEQTLRACGANGRMVRCSQVCADPV